MPEPFDLERCDAIGLMVEARESPGRVLLGVRSATPTSKRHPQILSTPTMRVPNSLMATVLGDIGAAATIAQVSLGSVQPLGLVSSTPIGREMSLRDPIAYLVESLLARKLGQAEALVGGQLSGDATPAAIAIDQVLDPASEHGAPEITQMLTVRVRLDAGPDVFPARTESYSSLHWVSAADLPLAVRGNRPTDLVPDIDLNVCLQGLCVRSAAVIANGGNDL